MIPKGGYQGLILFCLSVFVSVSLCNVRLKRSHDFYYCVLCFMLKLSLSEYCLLRPDMHSPLPEAESALYHFFDEVTVVKNKRMGRRRKNSIENHTVLFFILWRAVKLDCSTLHSVWSKLADQTTQLADKVVTSPTASGNTAQTLKLLIRDTGKILSCSLESC